MIILKLDYQGLPVYADREAEKQADSNTGKSRITKSRFIKAKRGNAGGTWLHPKLAVAFARWCDIDFALWCDEQIEALISSGREWGKPPTKPKFRRSC